MTVAVIISIIINSLNIIMPLIIILVIKKKKKKQYCMFKDWSFIININICFIFKD